MPSLVEPGWGLEGDPAAVRRQIDYGSERGVPWGVSESGYHTFDAALNYQYRAFGVPGLAGLPVGHGERNLALPYAARCEVDFDHGQLKFLDAAVS